MTGAVRPGLLLYAPMRWEATALRRGPDGAGAHPVDGPEQRAGVHPVEEPGRQAGAYFDPAVVSRCGTGPRRARRAGEPGRVAGATALAVAGIGGGLHPDLRTGDVVVASEVRAGDGSPVVLCPAAPLLAAALRRRGLTVHVGPVVSVRRPVIGARGRLRLAAGGALAVDTESVWLLRGAAGRPVGCVRVVADTSGEPMLRPATLARVRVALRVLAETGPAIAEWAAVALPQAAPRD